MNRLNFLLIFFFLGFLAISTRLFYWQVIASERLRAQANIQHFQIRKTPASRGRILTADSYPLVINEPSFVLYGLPSEMDGITKETAAKLAGIIVEEEKIEDEDFDKEEEKIISKLTQKDLVWVSLARNLSRKQKEAIENLGIDGLVLEEGERRGYPEASMAAQLLGFVGSDENGYPLGYYGLEGSYQRLLAGRPGRSVFEKDAQGRPILLGEEIVEETISGSDLELNLERPAQFIVEQALEKGIQKYQAKSGSVIVVEPQTGKIMAMASWPSFDPSQFEKADPYLFGSPVIAESFEPGSIFKVLVMASAIQEKAVQVGEKCDQCDGPRQIGEYTIRTWNDQYHPNSTMTEILQYSDNVGMVYVGEKLGLKRLYSYLKKFGFGEKTNIDLEGELSPFLRPKDQWYEIDQATVTFGQGIAVTPIQMVMAVSSIANQGMLMEPQVVAKIIAGGQERINKPRGIRQVISPTTAKIMTEMMVRAVDNGEAKWTKPKGFKIAGKTGTAQIPVAGHYEEEKTIASFIGFAPADEPRFVMLVTLKEPETSPWGSETAAPLWFDIAGRLFSYWEISPK